MRKFKGSEMDYRTIGWALDEIQLGWQVQTWSSEQHLNILSGWWFHPLWTEHIRVSWDYYFQHVEKWNGPNHQSVIYLYIYVQYSNLESNNYLFHAPLPSLVPEVPEAMDWPAGTVFFSSLWTSSKMMRMGYNRWSTHTTISTTYDIKAQRGGLSSLNPAWISPSTTLWIYANLAVTQTNMHAPK